MSEVTKGRIVHFVVAEKLEQAAIIVRVWPACACVDLIVFRDGTNDAGDGELPEDIGKLTAWRTSVVRSSDDQTKLCSWHFASECKEAGR